MVVLPVPATPITTTTGACGGTAHRLVAASRVPVDGHQYLALLPTWRRRAILKPIRYDVFKSP